VGRNRTGACLRTIALIAIIGGCGDDDHTFEDGGKPDSGGAAGRAGAAGGDSGRADTSTGGAGGGGNAGTGGRAGTSDAAPDVTNDGGVIDTRMDAGPTVDASNEPDATAIPDSSFDRTDPDDGATIDARDSADAPSIGDATDALVDGADVAGDSDAVDATSNDASGDADATASDVSDAAFDTVDGPSCNDGKLPTFDFYNPLYGCGHETDANPSDSDAWITYDAGFHVDVATGLGWAFPAGSRSASAAASACDAFSVAGLGNWRMPTIDEARSLAGGCARTASTGTCPIHDASCLAMSCGYQSPACDSCTGGPGSTGPNNGAYCKIDVAVCTFFHTSSVCPDCSDAGDRDWIYLPINGNFAALESASGYPTACVSVVPGGVPGADGG
jgi:hypothetical protein